MTPQTPRSWNEWCCITVTAEVETPGASPNRKGRGNACLPFQFGRVLELAACDKSPRLCKETSVRIERRWKRPRRAGFALEAGWFCVGRTLYCLAHTHDEALFRSSGADGRRDRARKRGRGVGADRAGAAKAGAIGACAGAVSSEPQSTTATFGDWVLRCNRTTVANQPQRVCEVAQTLEAERTGRRRPNRAWTPVWQGPFASDRRAGPQHFFFAWSAGRH